MKRNTLFSLVVCALTFHSINSAGQQAISESVRAANTLRRAGNLTSGDMIVALPSFRTSDVIGDTYWDPHWGESAILLFEKEQLVEGHVTRYDIQNDQFEFMIGSQVKVFPGKKIKNLMWVDSVMKNQRYLVNGRKYLFYGAPLTGFLEVLVDGKSALFRKIYLETLKPNFSPALNVGSKDTRILKKENYYYNIGTEVYKIKSKKDVAPLFQNKEEKMNAFIKDEKIKFSKEEDLIKAFTYFNSIQNQETK